MRVVTSDLDEAIAAVAKVYCAHDVTVLEGNRGVRAELAVSHGSRSQTVSLGYSAPVRIDAGVFENLLLFMTCAAGSGRATQGRSSVGWSKGRTLPLSPGLASQLEFDREFWQDSIRLDKAFVEDLCSTMISRPLERPLRFELRPFAPSLEQAWQQGLASRRLLQFLGLPTGSHTQRRCDEFLAALVLESHPHDYTRDLERQNKPTEPRMVREAEQLMRVFGPDITVGDIARELRVSLRSLELGFRQTRRMTPSQMHRQIRLSAARQELLNPTVATTVTGVAVTHGFVHLARFSGYYKATFGEKPSATLKRSTSVES